MIKIKIQKITTRGFTLIETIIYIGLFSLIFSGIFASIYPLLSSVERLTSNVASEGETAFVFAKINHALSSTIIDNNGTVTSPTAGTTGNDLIIEYNHHELFRFVENETNHYCVSPLVCHTITLEENGSGDALPLNAQRVQLTNFKVVHVPPRNGVPRYLDITCTANGKPVGPVRYYLHF